MSDVVSRTVVTDIVSSFYLKCNELTILSLLYIILVFNCHGTVCFLLVCHVWHLLKDSSFKRHMTKLAFYTLKVNFLPFEMLICSSFRSECLALFEEWECSVVKWQHKIPLSTKGARLPEKMKTFSLTWT